MKVLEADDFDGSFDELAQIAYRVGFRLLGDREDARDVAQEALARAYARWSKVHRYAEPWVARVATNLALGRLRKGRRPDALDRAAAERDQSDLVATRAVLVAALRRLPPRQRDVVVLRYLADLSEEQVAAFLGCSAGTVKSHAHRGLRALRIRLESNPAGLEGAFR